MQILKRINQIIEHLAVIQQLMIIVTKIVDASHLIQSLNVPTLRHIKFVLMNTIIEEKELDNELQELHLLSKNWMSEVQFLSGELNFLKRLISQPLKQSDGNSEKTNQINSNMSRLEENIDDVRRGIVRHLKCLEKLIKDPSQQFDLAIIEDHAALEKKISEDFRLIRSCKQDVFSFVR